MGYNGQDFFKNQETDEVYQQQDEGGPTDNGGGEITN